MVIKNAYVFTETAQFTRKDVYIAGHYFTDSSSSAGVVDASDLYAIPGLIDIHFHGCMGEDFSDGSPVGLHRIASYQAKNGVTSLCPATTTLPEKTLLKACSLAAEFEPEEGEADYVGINLEGPFFSKDKLGAQNADFVVPPDYAMYLRLQEASDDLIKLVDISPEQPEAIPFIKAVGEKSVCSLAHTSANYDQAMKAFEAGAAHVTHLFNAMPAFHHRDPGVIGAAFDQEGCMVELITDGVHIHPAVVRATLSMFGEDRVVFISDSMRATGLGDGTYSLGGQDVKVEGNCATLVEKGNLAGSATNLMDCLRVAVNDMRVPLETAVRCATMNAAQAIDCYDSYGSITPGKVANMLLVDEELNIKHVILRGKLLY